MKTDVEELLREGMQRYTADVRPPAGFAARAHRRRQRRRRTAWAAMAAGSAAAVAAVTIATATVAAAPDRPANAPPALTTAYVVGRVEATLAAQSHHGLVMVIQTEAGPQSSVQWVYGNRQRLEWFQSGQPLTESGRRGSQVVFVDYQNRTWLRVRKNLTSPTGRASGCSENWSAANVYSAWYIRATVACGGFAVAGHARVDGTQTVKLISTRRLRFSLGREILFVNASTYLPVRIVWPNLNFPVPPTIRTVREDFRWLPPTAANLALLKVTIPPGFRHSQLAAAARG
jgi:hypothetical protein